MTTVDSWPKTLPMLSAWSWNSTTETHLIGSYFSPVAIIFIFFSKFPHMDTLILLLSWHIKCSKLFVANICQQQLKLWQKRLQKKKIGFSSHIFFHHLDQERGETNLWLSSAPKVWRHFSMNIDAFKNNLFRLFSCDVSFFYPCLFLNKVNNKFDNSYSTCRIRCIAM